MKSKTIYILAILHYVTYFMASNTDHFSNQESMPSITQVWQEETKNAHIPKSRPCSLKTSQLSQS